MLASTTAGYQGIRQLFDIFCHTAILGGCSQLGENPSTGGKIIADTALVRFAMEEDTPIETCL